MLRMLCAVMLGLLSSVAVGQERPDDVARPGVVEIAPDQSRGTNAGTFVGGYCAVATTIVPPVLIEFDTSGYGADGPPGSCNSASAPVMLNDVWLKWTPDDNYVASLTITDLEPYDMVAAIYTGTCAALTEIYCLDEPEPMSQTFFAQEGVTYYIQVGDWGTAIGGGDTRLELDATPVNDACDDYFDLGTLEVDTTFDNSIAVANGSPGNCNFSGASTMQNAMWFRWSPDTSYHATLTLTELTSYDMTVQVWEGFSCSTLTAVACGDEPEPIVVDFEAQGGRIYWFQCGDWGTGAGGGETRLQLDLVPMNETCSTAEDIVLDSLFRFDNSLAASGGDPGSCNSTIATDMDNDLWYRWLVPNDMEVMLTADPTNYDGIVAIYNGTCAALSEIACGDEPEPIMTTFQATGGDTYYFQFGDWGTALGGGYTEALLTAIYPNESCASATPLPSGPLTIEIGNAGAQAGLPRGSCNRDIAFDMRNDLWWRWVAPVTGLVTFDLDDGDAWQSILAVHTGSCGDLVELGCDNNEFITGGSTVTIPVNRGQPYFIQIGDWGAFDQGGAGSLSIRYSAPANDECANATVVNDGTYYGHNMGAVTNGDATCGLNNSAQVWYTYKVIFDGELEVSTCGTHDWFGIDRGMDTVLSIHTTCPGTAANELACNDDSGACGGIGDIRDSYVRIPVDRGQIVTIQVASYFNSAPGVFQLHVNCLPQCPGDTNGDNAVNFADLEILLDEWNTVVSPGTGGDVTGDGLVNFADLEVLLEHWGADCR